MTILLSEEFATIFFIEFVPHAAAMRGLKRRNPGRLAEYEEMARRDEADRQKGAYKQGRQEGLQEGRQAGMIEVAWKALRENIPAEAVVRLTGLSLEEVNRIAADL
jgi:predicted transposase/invertase (TIGR01784 family)